MDKNEVIAFIKSNPEFCIRVVAELTNTSAGPSSIGSAVAALSSDLPSDKQAAAALAAAMLEFAGSALYAIASA